MQYINGDNGFRNSFDYFFDHGFFTFVHWLNPDSLILTPQRRIAWGLFHICSKQIRQLASETEKKRLLFGMWTE